MKKVKFKLLFVLFAGSLVFTGCGNNSSNNTEDHHHEEGMEHDHGEHESSMEEREVSTNMGDLKGDLSPLLHSYFNIIAKLATDDANGAAEGGKELVKSVVQFDKSKLSDSELLEFNDISESVEENAQHISENAGEIAHQREHLVSLSEDMRDLIALIGTDKKLYEVHCPMANNKKGANWISNQKEISNPYLGSAMPKCGNITREIN